MYAGTYAGTEPVVKPRALRKILRNLFSSSASHLLQGHRHGRGARGPCHGAHRAECESVNDAELRDFATESMQCTTRCNEPGLATESAAVVTAAAAIPSRHATTTATAGPPAAPAAGISAVSATTHCIDGRSSAPAAGTTAHDDGRPSGGAAYNGDSAPHCRW